ncbi:2,4-dihydroxyhept-2-ene-1,7-dioic acid aldolase [Halanaeroarchaeum sp. HSR-CO]|uniref:HpcH/HpaI aldolase family protein n=1 Tax=Halanaeroarchaeum sp. HSR-CO TaxID=2866382 RepID=UPI00217D76F1|nr:aldolase/citrate lyase family protein [Halanaeroarchaeum sp. HSR-CO]UWG46523.1 2,4-dihydroxyhept-2-ene-1,7-dioic acid aldolase [Halanaeroarchaeum sp. HSR-CO]
MDATVDGNGLATAFDGETVALGLLDNTYNPTLVEFYGELGLDFVWIDLEHGGPDPWDGPTIANLLRAAERSGIEVLLRLPDTDPTLVRKALDLGVRNVFLPRVETASEVEAAVRSARFRYEKGPGDRGLAAPRARRWGQVEGYVETEDAETVVGTTIETVAAVENIDDILAVPELGFVFIGPLDLSVALGQPNELDHPDVAAAVETVREAAIDAGVPVGGLGFGMDDVNEKAANGYSLLNVGSTTGALKQTVTGWLEAFDERPRSE